MIQNCLLDGTEDEKERTEIAKSTIINLTTQWAIAKHEKILLVVETLYHNAVINKDVKEFLNKKYKIINNKLHYNTDVICPLAWNHLSTFTNGDIRGCCEMIGKDVDYGKIYGNDKKIVSVHTHKLEQARNSDLYKKIRLEMVNGDKPQECNHCYSQENLNKGSKRLASISKYSQEIPDYILNTDLITGNINSSKVSLRDLDLRFGNSCNLKCTTCGPQDSNLWYEDYYKLEKQNTANDIVYFPYYGSSDKYGIEYKDGDYKITKNNFVYSSNSEFFKDILNNLDNVDTLYFTGGEPTINAQHKKLLKYCIEGNFSSKINIEYNSNLNSLPLYLLKYWKEFKHITFSASIDGHENVQEYMRPPSKWSTIEKNYKILKDYDSEKISIYIHPTYSIFNILNVRHLVEWNMKITNKNFNEIYNGHILRFPNQFCISNLPILVKKDIKEIYEKWFEKLASKITTENLNQIKQHFTSVLKFMDTPENPEQFQFFLNHTKKLENIRKNSHLRCLELKNLLDKHSILQ